MLKNGDTLKTRTIILATGAVHQTLGIEGEEKLKGWEYLIVQHVMEHFLEIR